MKIFNCTIGRKLDPTTTSFCLCMRLISFANPRLSFSLQNVFCLNFIEFKYIPRRNRMAAEWTRIFFPLLPTTFSSPLSAFCARICSSLVIFNHWINQTMLIGVLFNCSYRNFFHFPEPFTTVKLITNSCYLFILSNLVKEALLLFNLLLFTFQHSHQISKEKNLLWKFYARTKSEIFFILVSN